MRQSYAAAASAEIWPHHHYHPDEAKTTSYLVPPNAVHKISSIYYGDEEGIIKVADQLEKSCCISTSGSNEAGKEEDRKDAWRVASGEIAAVGPSGLLEQYHWNQRFQLLLERPVTTPEEARQRNAEIKMLATTYVAFPFTSSS